MYDHVGAILTNTAGAAAQTENSNGSDNESIPIPLRIHSHTIKGKHKLILLIIMRVLSFWMGSCPLSLDIGRVCAVFGESVGQAKYMYKQDESNVQ